MLKEDLIHRGLPLGVVTEEQVYCTGSICIPVIAAQDHANAVPMLIGLAAL